MGGTIDPHDGNVPAFGSSSDDPLLVGKRWTTLDLGVSWRTPWAGVLSVGAQNILSAPVNSPRDADGQARTPYIQYRQDL